MVLWINQQSAVNIITVPYVFQCLLLTFSLLMNLYYCTTTQSEISVGLFKLGVWLSPKVCPASLATRVLQTPAFSTHCHGMAHNLRRA